MKESENQQSEPRAAVKFSGWGSSRGVCVGLAVLCGVLGGLGFLRMQDQAEREQAVSLVARELVAVPRELGFEKARTLTRGEVASVHSATAVELEGGRMRAYWFGGTREGARDVSIWSAEWNGEVWSEPHVVLERLEQERLSGLNIRKLGNPVAHVAGDGAVELYFVGVAMGGWSGSAIYHVRSEDGGKSFGQPERLLVSPFVNISTLVKAPALDLDGGGVLLPVYHEFTDKFPQLLRLDKDRRVVGLVSLRGAKHLIQPWVVSGAEGEMRMFMRRSKHREHKRVHEAMSKDDGRTWGEFSPMEFANPNASVAATQVKQGVLLVCNNKEKGRDSLRVYFQPAGKEKWQFVYEVDGPEYEQDELDMGGLEYSYPWMMQTRDGLLHIFFTWNREQIRHVRFDARDWKEVAE